MMSPEEQIRQLLEENARLKAQLANPYASHQSRDYEDFQQHQQSDALRKEVADYQQFRSGRNYRHAVPNMYMRKEPRRNPIGLDGY